MEKNKVKIKTTFCSFDYFSYKRHETWMRKSGKRGGGNHGRFGGKAADMYILTRMTSKLGSLYAWTVIAALLSQNVMIHAYHVNTH